MFNASEFYNLYKFGLNYGFIIKLKDGYGLVIAPEGDFQNCILTERFNCESEYRFYLKYNADYGLIVASVPDWKFHDISKYEDVYEDSERVVRLSK